MNNNSVEQSHHEELRSDDHVRSVDKVLLPHDLYEHIDYSSNKSTSARNNHDTSKRNNLETLYATVVPRSKRMKDATNERPISGSHDHSQPIRGQEKILGANERPIRGQGGVIISDTDEGPPISVRLVPGEKDSGEISQLRHISMRNNLGVRASEIGVSLDNEDNDTTQTPLAVDSSEHPANQRPVSGSRDHARPIRGPLSSIPEVVMSGNSQKRHEIDSLIRQKIRREFALLQRVRRSRILNRDGGNTEKTASTLENYPSITDGENAEKTASTLANYPSLTDGGNIEKTANALAKSQTFADGGNIEKTASTLANSAKFLLPPVCGKSPPCDCPEGRENILLKNMQTKNTLLKKYVQMSTQAAHFIIVFLIVIIHLCFDLYRNVLYCTVQVALCKIFRPA